MKKFFALALTSTILFLGTGCSGTWEGVKSDTDKAWNSTKESIHEATK